MTIGYQNWRGLADTSPSDALRANGYTGAWDTKSPVFGLIGSMGAYRGHGLDVAVDLRLETFAAQTKENFVYPEDTMLFVDKYDLNSVRLGVDGRVTFRRTHRIQPTVSAGMAFGQVSRTTTQRIDASAGYGPTFSDSSITFDLKVSGGLDVPCQKNPAQGVRFRFEAEIDHLGYTYTQVPTGNEPGPLAVRLALSILYSHDEPKFWAP